MEKKFAFEEPILIQTLIKQIQEDEKKVRKMKKELEKPIFKN